MPAGAAAAAGRPAAVRAAAPHHRRHPHARREDDAGPAARLHTAHAQVLHGSVMVHLHTEVRIRSHICALTHLVHMSSNAILHPFLKNDNIIVRFLKILSKCLLLIAICFC